MEIWVWTKPLVPAASGWIGDRPVFFWAERSMPVLASPSFFPM
ncbi:MAG: hypothetical protein R2705_10860 [Ilumatobacteraceae bacterium]